MSAPGPVPTPAATPAPTPASVPAPPPPVVPPPAARDFLARTSFPYQPADFAAKGYHLNGVVRPDQVKEAALELDHEGFALDTITGVDWLAEKQMEVVYDYFHPLTGLRVVLRSRIARDNPEISSISEVFPGANWHERETHDFFGINFRGHPDLSPFLLPEDATYHPLRKDFTS
jgi:NADH-quinone oxidoreductase subunit C